MLGPLNNKKNNKPAKKEKSPNKKSKKKKSESIKFKFIEESKDGIKTKCVFREMKYYNNKVVFLFHFREVMSLM